MRVAKTVSVAELGHGAASRAIREAQQEPVLVSGENRPAVWIVSAEGLAQAAATHGKEAADTYQRALELLAVESFRQEDLTLGRGAKLAGMALSDFIDLCGELGAPVLWEPEGGIEAEVEHLGRKAGQQVDLG
jgi:hypothetical protein